MEFYPDTPLDDSAPQRRVWEAIRAAFAEEEGATFYRYPIFSPDGLLRREADVLVALRRYGLFLVEVKGYRIDTIQSIEGHVWSTAPWYTDEEYPVQQVDDQLFALKDWLRGAPEIGLHYAVAVPFIARPEWEGAGWHELPTTQCVRTADDLTPEALHAWVRRTAQAYPVSLSDAEWEAVRNRLGRSLRPPTPTPTLRVPTTTPIIHRYPGRIPNADEIRTATGLSPDATPQADDYLYLVATAILERYRGQRRGTASGPEFAPRRQLEQVDLASGRTELQPQLMFGRALDTLMKPWLDREGLRLPFGPIERHYFLTAVETVAADDTQGAQIAHDARTWRTVIGQLDAEGLDLSDPTVLASVRGRFAHPDLADLASDLQAAFHRAVPAGEITAERAAYRFLMEAFVPAPTVVMEGFSFLRPLQRLFAQRVADQGAALHVIHPYREEQSFGFEALDLTYDDGTRTDGDCAPFVGAGVQPLHTPTLAATDLDHLKASLFSDAPPTWTAQADDSVRLAVYPHRHAEVRACVEAIAALLADGATRRNIRIITRDPDGYRDLLLEELDLFRYEQTARGDAPLPADLFEVPPRQLLLTPLGRFVLTLYNVWEDGELSMDPDQFATVLSSGLLGHSVQRSAARFLSARDQVFARCRSVADWRDALGALGDLQTGAPERARLPTSTLHPSDVSTWSAALQFVVQLATRLFDGTERSIGEHIAQLREALRGVNRLGMFEAESEVLDRIDSVLSDLESVRTVRIPTDRFREVLNGLVRDRADEPDSDDPSRVAVIAPEGLDSSEQAYVFFLGLDAQHVPRPYAEPWPFFDDRLESDLAQERYLFLAAVRATTQQLTLSYPLVNNREVLQPSPYLEEVADVLGVELAAAPQPVIDPEGGEKGSDVSSPSSPQRRFRRAYDEDPYTLSQLYHFALCPYRYKLERLDPRAQAYTSRFQAPLSRPRPLARSGICPMGRGRGARNGHRGDPRPCAPLRERR